MPSGRTGIYLQWRACERLNILPFNIKNVWEDNGVFEQAMILAYEDIRQYEDSGANQAKTH